MVKFLTIALIFAGSMWFAGTVQPKSNPNTNAETPATAAPVTVNPDLCVLANYPDANAYFALYFNQPEAEAQINGELHTLNAETFQIEPGVWLACDQAGNYIRIEAGGETEYNLNGKSGRLK